MISFEFDEVIDIDGFGEFEKICDLCKLENFAILKNSCSTLSLELAEFRMMRMI